MGNNACDNLESAFLLIGENISQYEENVKEKENGFDYLNELLLVKHNEQNILAHVIAAQLEILNAMSNDEYHWNRQTRRHNFQQNLQSNRFQHKCKC